MVVTPPRVYADSSVFGGAFDTEFAGPSRAFFDLVRQNQFQLVSSRVVEVEISTAPEAVQALFAEMVAMADVVQITVEAVALQRAYLARGIVGPASVADALHVALATASRCGIIVSWNFRHLVHYQKIPLYNAVNAVLGFPTIAIHSPQEVLPDEEEDV
jgi:hypothetical protein